MAKVNQKYEHKTENDLFSSPEELAKAATSLGITCEEYVTRYYDNLDDAKIWNTARRFIATVQGVRAETIAGGLNHGYVDYEVRAGTETAEKGEIRVGVLHPTDKLNPINRKCTKARELLNQKAIITKGYRKGTDGGDFITLLSIEPLK
jgi:hypothetical protein